MLKAAVFTSGVTVSSSALRRAVDQERERALHCDLAALPDDVHRHRPVRHALKADA